MPSNFSMYNLCGDNGRIELPAANVYLRRMAPGDFNFFHREGIDGRRRDVPTRVALEVFNQCIQHGGCMTAVLAGMDLLVGTVWLTPRDENATSLDLYLAMTDEDQSALVGAEIIREILRLLGEDKTVRIFTRHAYQQNACLLLGITSVISDRWGKYFIYPSEGVCLDVEENDSLRAINLD